MAKQSGGSQLVVDIDADGKLSATAVRRTLYVDDDDGIVSTKNEPITLAQLGDDFPWAEFIGPALQAALLNSEETDQLRTDLASAVETVKQKEADIEIRNNTILDRDQLIANIFASLQSLTNGVSAEIQARMPKEPGA